MEEEEVDLGMVEVLAMEGGASGSSHAVSEMGE